MANAITPESERDEPFSVNDIPFPVTAPFRMQPGLTRLDESLTESLTPDCARLLQPSRDAAQQAGLLKRSPLLVPSPTDTRHAANLDAALTQIRLALSEVPAFSINPEKQTNARKQGDGSGNEQLLEQAGDLRCQMQDDFVLMTAENARDLRASLMAVAMPSGWNPADKLGQRFLQLHQPVAGAEMIRQAAPSLCAMMRAPGALRRHVWTLVNSADLSRHPDDWLNGPVETLDDVWFRCERQTSHSLLQGAVVLFLIRIYVVRLTEILAVDPAREGLLYAALSSMSDSIITYKSLQQIQPLVLRLLSSVNSLPLTRAGKQNE